MPWQYPMFSMLNEKSSEPPKNHVWAEVGKEPKRHFLFGLLLTRRSQEFFVGPRKRHHSLQALEQKRLLKIDGRPTDALPFEVDSYLDTVGNLDKGNAIIHAVLLSVEGHCPFDCPRAGPLACNRKVQLLLLGYTANCKVAIELNRIGAGLHSFRRVKGD